MSKRVLNPWFLLAAAASAACAIDATGCGGSSSNTGPSGNPDGSPDVNVSSDDSGFDSSSTTDAPSNTEDVGTPNDGSSGGNPDTGTTGPDGATMSDASDAGSTPDTGTVVPDAGDSGSACPTGTACANGSGSGICAAGVCGTCASGGTSAGPDVGCTTAYGGGTTQYVCVTGSCVAGNCNTNTDCTTAGMPTCGFTTPNVCGGCTSDSQCGSTQICDTVTTDANYGKCVSSACPVTASTTTACTANPSDVCCAAACVPGNCCYPTANHLTTSDCTGQNATCKPTMANETTGGGICTTCTAVTTGTYVVDPSQGNDGTGTGNTAGATPTPTCAFKTIARALQVIGPSPVAGTTIAIVNSGLGTNPGVVSTSSGEKFPIVIPKNVTLTTTGSMAVTIQVPAATGHGATQGVLLSGNPAALSGTTGAALTIDGQTNAATNGVVVESAAATIGLVTIKNFAADGIVDTNVGSTTSGSALTIGAGVVSIGNGQDGLAVMDNATATISGTATSPAAFNNNGAHGIMVRGNGGITVNGVLGGAPPSGSTVIASGNKAAGIWIEQTAGSTVKNTLTGVVCTAGNANGLRIIPGSNVVVRNGWFLGNTGNGIDVENSTGGGSTSLANIDLGSATSAGGNVVQGLPGGALNTLNGGAGICLNIAKGATAGAVLSARGNIFGGATGNATLINCATAPSALKVNASFSCDHADVGGSNIVAFPVAAATTSNAIDVTMCTY